MKILYVCWDYLEQYPPCQTQLDLLTKSNHSVTLVYRSLVSDSAQVWFTKLHQNFRTPAFVEGAGKLSKIKTILDFRKVINSLVKHEHYDLVWFGTEKSALYSAKIVGNIPYIFNCLEYYEKGTTLSRLCGIAAKRAAVCTSCELTRAWLMKLDWQLSELPVVLPNKISKHPRKRYLSPTRSDTAAAINKMKGKRCILYQGWLTNDRSLEAVANALAELDCDIMLALMAPDNLDTQTSIRKLSAIYKRTIYLGYIPSPFHLEVTSHSFIGIARYEGNIINNILCAPNKIYEYAGFGIPILGNNVPGLQYSVGMRKAGLCVDFDNRKDLTNALNELLTNSDMYKNGSEELFEGTDYEAAFQKVILCAANKVKQAQNQGDAA